MRMKPSLNDLEAGIVDKIIAMAWSDRVSFDRIKKETGFCEADVIRLMRRELKPSSFKLWRARVTGRITKHRKRFKLRDQR